LIEVYTYISCGLRYLIEIWYLQGAVIASESGDSIAAMLWIDNDNSAEVDFFGWNLACRHNRREYT